MAEVAAAEGIPFATCTTQLATTTQEMLQLEEIVILIQVILSSWTRSFKQIGSIVSNISHSM